MEQLPAFGTEIRHVAPLTHKAFAPLLIVNGDAIKSTSVKTFQYGPHSRQALDVYYPSSQTSSSSTGKDTPILLFFYGGGLVQGDKTLAMPFLHDLVHANIGHFFAEKTGYVTVIADYRLISHGAKFPSGGEDVALVVEWVKANLASKEGNSKDLFMMGNSAGGIHLATFLFAPDFAETRKSISPQNEDNALKLKGAVLLSVPFHFREAAPNRAETLHAYFGQQVDDRCPLGLLKAAVAQNPDPLPGVGLLVMNGTLDPETEILKPKEDFLGACNTPELKKKLTVEMMEGQNHISPPFSLGTNKSNEEAWGYQVSAWIQSLR